MRYVFGCILGAAGANLLLLGLQVATRPDVAQAQSSVAAQRNGQPARFLLEWGKRGSGPGEFHFPIGITISPADEIFVSDHYNNRVQKFDRNGKSLASFAVLPNPGGIGIDTSGNLYIAHFGGSRLDPEKRPNRVSVYDISGKLLREWGKTGTGDGEFDFPGGVAVGHDRRVYVADQTNRRVQVFDCDGRFLTKWGEYGTGPGQFGGNISPASRVGGPQFVAIDSTGNLYTTEGSVGRVQKFAPDGKFLLAWGDNEDKPGSFGGEFKGFKASLRGPIGICVDQQDRLWVSAVSGRIQRFSSDGKYQDGFGQEQGSAPGQFLAPHGLAVDSRGHLYVVDSFNHRVQKFAVAP